MNAMAVELGDPGESVEAACNGNIARTVRECGRGKQGQGELRYVEQLKKSESRSGHKWEHSQQQLARAKSSN